MKRVICLHSFDEDTMAIDRFLGLVFGLRRAGFQIGDDAGLAKEYNKYIALTIDDGYKNVVTNLLPVLIENKIKATLFIITGCLGFTKAEVQITNHGMYQNQEIMDREDVQNWLNAGMRLGFHTHNHIDLKNTPWDVIEKDFIEGDKVYSELIQGAQAEKIFAYPFGILPKEKSRFIKLLKDNGYSSAFTTKPGQVSTTESLFIPRIILGNQDSEKKLFLKSIGWLDFYMKIRGFRWKGY